jgi:hypothetical protein
MISYTLLKIKDKSTFGAKLTELDHQSQNVKNRIQKRMDKRR